MATYDLTASADGKYTFKDWGVGFIKRSVDWSKGTGTAAAATGDVLQLFVIPAGFLVEDCFSIVTTTGTTSSTVTVGDGDDADGFITSANTQTGVTKANGAYLHDPTSAATAAGTVNKYYPAVKTFSVTLGATAPIVGVTDFVLVGRFIK